MEKSTCIYCNKNLEADYIIIHHGKEPRKNPSRRANDRKRGEHLRRTKYKVYRVAKPSRQSKLVVLPRDVMCKERIKSMMMRETVKQGWVR